MKYLRLTLIAALFGLFISCDNDDDAPNPQPEPEASCIPSNLQTDLIAFYPFSGGSLNDFSGNGYDLSNPTSAFSSEDRDGNSNCAFEFVASNDDFLTYVNPTFLDDLDSLPFSVSLWFKAEGTRNPGDYELLIGRDEGMHCPDTFGEWSLGLYDCRNAAFGINDYSIWGEEPYGNTDCTNDPSLNVWHHLVVTSGGTSGNIAMYVDGISTSNIPGTGCSNPVGTNNVGDLFLGKGFTGLLDDVMIFGKELNQSEVIQLFELDACCQ